MPKLFLATQTERASILEAFRTPVFAPLMQQRVLARAICLAAAGLLALSALGVSVWQCPVRQALGVSCPGCGLTRATLLLLRGDLRAALQTHAYAPLLLLAMALLFFAAALPREYSRRLAEVVARLEKRTFLGAVALALLPIYWIFRLFFGVLPR